jgi:hypothetical protein
MIERSSILLLLVTACAVSAGEVDCTAQGWDIVGNIGSVHDGCVRVWSVSETMSVAEEGSTCSEAIENRCVVVSRGAWVTVRAKMGSASHVGVDGLPISTAAYLDDDGSCPLRCDEGLAPESWR